MKKIEFPSWDGYTQTRHSLLAICQLNHTAAQILNILLNPLTFMIEAENRVRISLREIESLTGYVFSRKKIISSISLLEQLGYIHKRKYETLTNVYQINFEAVQVAINEISTRSECDEILSSRSERSTSSNRKAVPKDA